MFQRQWFKPNSQVALCEPALHVEHLVRCKTYSTALKFLVNLYHEAKDQDLKDYWHRQIKRVEHLMLHIRDQPIRISFNDFWSGFNVHDNSLLNLLRHCCSLLGRQIEVVSTGADLELFSCFGNSCLQPPCATRILYLGENVRPNFSIFDYALSFDIQSYCHRNLYLPIWILRLGQFAPRIVDYPILKESELEKPINVKGDPKSVIYIGNNHTPLRTELVYCLRNSGYAVDCVGSQTQQVSDKLEAMCNYRFSIAIENSYHPGYVTEKLFDSFLGGTIPIYYGGIPSKFFNRESFIDLNPYSDLHNILPYEMSRVAESFHGSSYNSPLVRKGFISEQTTRITSWLTKLIYDLFC